MSPSSITRSPNSWWGLAPFGPEPTTVKSTSEWPCSRRKPASSAAISLSGRPAKRTCLICSKLASAAAPAAASRSSSSASLTARSIGSVLVIDTYPDSGSASWSPSTCIAHAESEIAYFPRGSSSFAVAS
jgi:hypothetical protein